MQHAKLLAAKRSPKQSLARLRLLSELSRDLEHLPLHDRRNESIEPHRSNDDTPLPWGEGLGERARAPHLVPLRELVRGEEGAEEHGVTEGVESRNRIAVGGVV